MLAVRPYCGALSRRTRESIAHVARGREDVVIDEDGGSASMSEAIAAAAAVVGLPRERILGPVFAAAVAAGVPTVVSDDVVLLRGAAEPWVLRVSPAGTTEEGKDGACDGPSIRGRRLAGAGSRMREVADSRRGSRSALGSTVLPSLTGAVGARLLELVVGPLGDSAPGRPVRMVR